MRMGSIGSRWGRVTAVLVVAALAAMFNYSTASAAGPMPGAVFTTDSTCSGVDLNIYLSKGAVYLNGGPSHPGAAGLNGGEYYVQVTEPDGDLLGTSVGTADETPVVVVNGEFASCYQLEAILISALNGQPGYDTTSNPGGEYKVWVSTSPTFESSASKTDNFKVRPQDGEPEEPDEATLNVVKFYDANANGLNDDGQEITGWKVNIKDGIDIDRFTPVAAVVAPDDYIVSEYMPVETHWMATTPSPVSITLASGDDETVGFGNLCVGAGGGLTLGFWSNRNGQKLVGVDDLALLTSLNLRNANGSVFDPTTAASLSRWLLSANATNMANMLSAQLAAMELNVLNGNVNGGALIYAPGTTSANSLGFATVNAVMAEADTSLGADGDTVAAGAIRTYQEALKNAMDAGNNNLSFVQATPCAFTFA